MSLFILLPSQNALQFSYVTVISSYVFTGLKKIVLFTNLSNSVVFCYVFYDIIKTLLSVKYYSVNKSNTA